ncbi:MAG: MBL fold metallo-hydrolase [Pseudomonadota bacterium]
MSVPPSVPPSVPVVDPADWWRVTRLADDVTLIDEHHVDPMFRCNCWHIRGRDRDLLIDSGLGVVSLRAWVPLVTERALLAVASHTHFDHIGCHHEFDARAVHRAEAALIAAPGRQATLANLYATDAMYVTGRPPGWDAGAYEVTPAPATRLLDDGEVISTGDRAFEVVHTPGHSPGGIALWEAATATLFSGDLVYDGPLIEDTYHADPDDYVASMQRLLEIPARTVHAGHFPSYDGARHRAIIRAWLDEKGA